MGQYEAGALPVRSSPAWSQRPAGFSRSFRWLKAKLGQSNSSVSDPTIPMFSPLLPPTYTKNIHLIAAKRPFACVFELLFHFPSCYACI